MAGNNSKVPSPPELVTLQQQLEALTAHIPTEKRMQQSELLREVNAVFPGFKDHDLRYLKRLKLIPQRKRGKGSYNYSVDDLRDVLLIRALQDEKGEWRISSYSQIAGLMIEMLRGKLENTLKISGTIEVGVSWSQRERGFLHWRGNLVRYFLLYLFDGKVPPSALVFLFRPRHRIGETSRNGRTPWLTIKKCGYPTVAYRLDKSEPTLATAENGEVLHTPVDKATIEKYQNELWYSIEGGGFKDPVDYEVIIATPNYPQPYSYSSPENPDTITLLLSLIDGCFLDFEDVAQHTNRPVTALDVVTDLVPKMSPAWRYCACLEPSITTPGRLVVQSVSKQFPSDSQRTVQIVNIGQLLSGRAYQEGYPVVVQRTIEEDDPRITDDRATAAAAVPTLYDGQPNGALYVATRNSLDTDKPFSDADIGLLRILGLIAGQLLGQNKALQSSGRMNLAIIDDRKSEARPWDDLKEELTDLLSELRASDLSTSGKDSVQLVAVQLKNYDQLAERWKDIADWAVQQLQYSAVRYFIEQGAGSPEIYMRNQREFLLLLRRVSSNDEYEQRVRRELRERLNSLSLAIPRETQYIRVESDLWSLPFRYASLLLFEAGELEKQVTGMIETIAQAFVTLPHIHLAHQYERNGAWPKALAEYRTAHRLALNNMYIVRHIAKALTQRQFHKDAVAWWHEVLEEQKHPSHYRRLAHNLFAQGTEEGYQMAINACNKAIDLDKKDAKSHAAAGDIYYLGGEYEKAIRALETAVAFDPGNAAHYHLRIAEAYLALEQCKEALDACTVAQTYELDNREIPFMMMKIARTMNLKENSLPSSSRPSTALET